MAPLRVVLSGGKNLLRVVKWPRMNADKSADLIRVSSAAKLHLVQQIDQVGLGFVEDNDFLCEVRVRVEEGAEAVYFV